MKAIILLIFFLNVFFCYSQENRKDSIVANNFEGMEKELFYDQFPVYPGSLSGDFLQFKPSFLNPLFLPETNWKIDFNALENPFAPAITSSMVYGYQPFFGSFSIMNQARYQINNRLSIGGNSFSGSSIFDPVPLNRPFNERNINGASMFLEYKVSKKFKIETRVTVTNRESMFPAP